MPNHTDIIITTDLSTLKKIKQKHYTYNPDKKGYTFDFNTIIPQPKTSIECLSKYPDCYIHNKTDLRKLPISIDASVKLEDMGYLNGYKGNIDNGGTKGNAYEGNVPKKFGDSFKNSDEPINFGSAGAAPGPILEKLSKLYPKSELEIEITYEDEGDDPVLLILKNGYQIN